MRGIRRSGGFRGAGWVEGFGRGLLLDGSESGISWGVWNEAIKGCTDCVISDVFL